MSERDNSAQRKYAERISREEGRKGGRAEGREERISIAKKLFDLGAPIDVIISRTGIDKTTAAALFLQCRGNRK